MPLTALHDVGDWNVHSVAMMRAPTASAECRQRPKVRPFWVVPPAVSWQRSSLTSVKLAPPETHTAAPRHSDPPMRQSLTVRRAELEMFSRPNASPAVPVEPVVVMCRPEMVLGAL